MRKLLIGLLVIVLVVGLLVPGTMAADKKVTLKLILWSNAPTVNAIKALNAKFTKKNPSITVEVTDVNSNTYPQLENTRIAAGDVDIIAEKAFVGNPPEWATNVDKPDWLVYVEQGIFEDLTNQPFIKNYTPASIHDAASINGKVYAVNTGSVAFNGVFYNKALFKKYNLKVPQTWNEYMQLCKTLQSKGVAPMTVGGKDGWPYAMMMQGIIAAFEPDMAGMVKDFYLGQRKFNDEKGLKLLRKMEEWTGYMEKGFTGIDYNSVIGRFIAGKAAMLPDGTWQAPAIAEADPTFDFGYFVIPGEKAGDSTQLAGKYDLQWAIYSKSKNKDAALKWLSFFSEKANYTEYINAVGFIPTQPGTKVTNKFVNSLAPMMKNFRLAYDQLQISRKGAGQYAGFQTQFLKAAGGPIATVEELANLAQSDWDAAAPKQ